MLSKRTLGIIFSNMHDYMVGELTEKRSMGSIPFGGRYRTIDFPLSWMVNAGVREVGVITKSNYQSLMDHLGSGREWDLARKNGGLSILPPFGSADSSGIYRGRVEALTGVMSYIRSSRSKYVVLSDCDIVANIDVEDVVNTHIAKGADITVVCHKGTVSREQVRDTTIFLLDENSFVRGARSHPAPEEEHEVFLNIMVMSKSLLESIVADCYSRNLFSFMDGVFQEKPLRHNIYSYEHKGCVMRISTMKDYFQANIGLLDPGVRSEIFVRERPIYTKVRDEPPAKYGLDSHVKNSLIADGCFIEGTVENCVLFRGVHVGQGASVKNSIIMQDTFIGGLANLDYVIADKNVRIRDGRTIIGFETYPIYISKSSVV